MLSEIQKKYIIKIPDNISLIYCNKKKIITVFGPLLKKSLKLKVKLILFKKLKVIKVSSVPFNTISIFKQKKMKTIQGTTCALIKQTFIETTSIIHKKLKFVGVGYRLTAVESFENQLILLRLGFSHLFYFKIPKVLKIFYKKRTKLFIFGNSYPLVTQIASNIRLLKKPEPYKGKGILYENEKIILKEGKKI